MYLSTPRLTLRPWRADDATGLAAAGDDIRIWRTVRDRFPHPYTLDHAVDCIARQTAEPEPTQLAIEIDDFIVRGIGWIPGADVQRITAELGYRVTVPYWGRGVATEAVGTVTSALRHRSAAAPPVRHRRHQQPGLGARARA
jgi:ribosomal-protein-alanine N-acetyltransferase